MWVLAVMCTCIQMHACRIVCKIASMQVCARVYTGACRYVLRWSHQQRMGQNRRFTVWPLPWFLRPGWAGTYVSLCTLLWVSNVGPLIRLEAPRARVSPQLGSCGVAPGDRNSATSEPR